MKEVKQTVASNIVNYRKKCKMTQAELADKLNYSDKSVSKWERGESIPDAVVLTQMAELFGVTVNDLLCQSDIVHKTSFDIKRLLQNKHIMVTLLSAVGVWLIATIVFVVLAMCNALPGYDWLTFIYALPVMFIVLTVLTCIWFNNIYRCLAVSGLIWTLVLSIYLTFKMTNAWTIFLIAIPLQVMAILGFILLASKDKVRHWFEKKK